MFCWCIKGMHEVAYQFVHRRRESVCWICRKLSHGGVATIILSTAGTAQYRVGADVELSVALLASSRIQLHPIFGVLITVIMRLGDRNRPYMGYRRALSMGSSRMCNFKIIAWNGRLCNLAASFRCFKLQLVPVISEEHHISSITKSTISIQRCSRLQSFKSLLLMRFISYMRVFKDVP